MANSSQQSEEAKPGDPPIEPKLDDAFDRLIDEGQQRLHRDFLSLLATGAVAGMEVGTGVLLLLAVQAATGSPLIAGLAFSVGFFSLLLGHSELFTEGFLVPVSTVAAGRATFWQLLRLWGGTMVANFAGGWLIGFILMRAFPELHHQAIESAAHFAQAGWSVRSFCLAVLAGSSMTLMTRMQHGTDAMSGKLAAAMAGAVLVAGLKLFHSVLDTLLIFDGLTAGGAPFGYLDWLNFLSLAIVGNILGGVGLVTLLRLVRSRDRIRIERAHHA